MSAAAEVKASTTSTRNRNKFCAPYEIRDMASEAAKCQNPVRKKAIAQDREARREFEAGRAALPRDGDKTGLWSRSFGSTDVPARTETSGQKRSEPTVNDATTTKRKGSHSG